MNDSRIQDEFRSVDMRIVLMAKDCIVIINVYIYILMFVDIFQSLCHSCDTFRLTLPCHEDMAPFRGGTV